MGPQTVEDRRPKYGDGKHDCGAASCKRRINKDKAFCGYHWDMVPHAMKDAINRAWRARDREKVAFAVRTAREYLEGEFGE